MKKIILLILACFLVSPAFASKSPYEDLKKITKFTCSFDQGTSTDWRSGKPKVELNHFGKKSDLKIFSIDQKAGTAKILGNNNVVTEVVLLTSTVGLTLIEETFGGLVFRTIYAEYVPGSKKYIVVMSRHLNVSGAFPSQYHGTCE